MNSTAVAWPIPVPAPEIIHVVKCMFNNQLNMFPYAITQNIYYAKSIKITM